jgi:hypothetical protein
MRTILPSIAAATFLATTPLAALADPAVPHHVRGTVASVSGDKVTIATAQGPVVVTVSPKTHYAGVIPGSASDITPGTFIGTANVNGPGAARALEVVVFPKAMNGTGEGDYPWDLPAGGGHMSAMTNGTVAAPKMSCRSCASFPHRKRSSYRARTSWRFRPYRRPARSSLGNRARPHRCNALSTLLTRLPRSL